MKKIFFFLFLITGVSAFSQTTSPVTKIAAYNMDSVLDRLPAAQEAMLELNKLEEKQKTEMTLSQKELERKKHEYDSCTTRHMWSALISALKEKEIMDLTINLQRLQSQHDSIYELRRHVLMDPVFKDIEAAAIAAAQEKGCQKIIDTTGADPAKVYGENTICIYEDICRKLGIAR